MRTRVLMPFVAAVATACSASAAHTPQASSSAESPSSSSSSQPPCDGRVLRVTAGAVVRGANNVAYVAVRVQNPTQTACVVSTPPIVRFDNGGDQVNREGTPGPGFTIGLLGPGASSDFTIGWIAPPQCQPNHSARIVAITVAILGATHQFQGRDHNFGSYCWVDEIAVHR